MMSSLLSVMGDQSGARCHFDSMLARQISQTRRFPLLQHDFEEHRQILGPVLWFQGLPDQAVRVAAKSVDDAISFLRPNSLCNVLGLLAWPIAILVGDLVEAQRCIQLLRDLRVKKSLFHESWTRGVEAGLLIKRGNVEFGVQALGTALVEHSKAYGKLYRAILTIILGRTVAQAGFHGNGDQLPAHSRDREPAQL
jgi:hypothetical protein